MSHPVWVRGLKLSEVNNERAYSTSHPVWVRGLKHKRSNITNPPNLSHPVWVRGLKHLLRVAQCVKQIVAPRVGAWIETRLQSR